MVIVIENTKMPGLVINIKAGNTIKESSISANGQLVHVIDDSERPSFGIGSDDDLKKVVESYFGKEPTDAYLKGPTPQHLYKSYGWPQVQTVLVPKKAQILEVNTKPTVLKTDTITNTSEHTATFTSKLLYDVTDTVVNKWRDSCKVSFQQMIDYRIDLLGIGAGTGTSIDYQQKWGQSDKVTKKSTVGTRAGVSFGLKPGKSAIVELGASSGTMRVRIIYEASLIGKTALNYNPVYKGHHFWGLPIRRVLGEPGKVQIVEDIDLGFHCNATVKVRNAKTNEEMKFLYAESPIESPAVVS